MAMRRSDDMIEDVGIIGGLIGIQFLYAGNAVFVSYLMSLGISALTIVIFSSCANFLLLLPFASYFERSRWPKMMSLKVIVRVLLLAFGGVLFQSLFLKGLNLTSPAIGTAMPNLTPGLVFVIACAFRLEKVDLSCTYSRVKILGTMLCILGAITMSIMQSISSPKDAKESAPQSSVTAVPPPPPHFIVDEDKILGCLYLLAAVVMMSISIVLQAFTLAEFPAPISLTAVTSFLGASMAAILQLLAEHELKTGWPLVTVRDLIGYSLLAGAMTGTFLSFNNWALRKRGPVLVSMFSPIATVISVVFSVLKLGDSFNIGSLAGMLLMFMGLYLVLWAKGKEGYVNIGIESDAEKPLLT